MSVEAVLLIDTYSVGELFGVLHANYRIEGTRLYNSVAVSSEIVGSSSVCAHIAVARAIYKYFCIPRLPPGLRLRHERFHFSVWGVRSYTIRKIQKVNF